MTPGDLIIIGGGPSGMAAAIEARRNGVSSVTILESNDSLGAKLLLTGAGRCNFTNSSIMASAYPRNGDTTVIENLVDQFDGQAIIDWFKDLGLKVETDSAGRVFPFPGKARSLISLLEMELRDLGVKVVLSTSVTSVHKERESGLFIIDTLKGRFCCRLLIVATGGKSYPSTGSDGNGYELLRKLGHRITNLTPVMVPLNCKFRAQKMLHGQKWFAELELLKRENILHRTSGDIMFTKNGITGLGVFELTAFAAPVDYDGLSVRISLFPDDEDGLNAVSKLLELSEKYFERTILELFVGILPSKLVKAFTREDDLNRSLKNSGPHVFNEALNRTVLSMCKITIPVSSHGGWSHGQITAGGVQINEIDETFRSRLVEGLWITGEILDVHGICGGYNLHFAWSSGIIAARATSSCL